MPTNSPMSNFNRKNPLVILAKSKYEELMQMYEKIAKNIVCITGTVSIVIILRIIYTLIYTSGKSQVVIIVSLLFGLMIILGLTGLLITNTIKSPINKDIDKMVSLEQSEILNINIEFVQSVIYKLEYCLGTCRCSIWWYHASVMSTFILSLSIPMLMEVLYG